ncbi:hypothetical protein THAOC_23157, partial [Thalassiosira oceanica]
MTHRHNLSVQFLDFTISDGGAGGDATAGAAAGKAGGRRHRRGGTRETIEGVDAIFKANSGQSEPGDARASDVSDFASRVYSSWGAGDSRGSLTVAAPGKDDGGDAEEQGDGSASDRASFTRSLRSSWDSGDGGGDGADGGGVPDAFEPPSPAQ